MIHELKVWPWTFETLAAGARMLEVRWGDDRQFAAGDSILFREWDHELGAYTGRWLTARIGACEGLVPAWYGAQGDTVWLLHLAAVGPLQIGTPAVWAPGTVTLGVAAAAAVGFADVAAWPIWAPVDGVEVTHAHAQPEGAAPGGPYAVVVRQVQAGAGAAGLQVWVAACEEAEAGCGRCCVVRFEPVAGGVRVVRYIPLARVVVTRVQRGADLCLYERLEMLGGWPEEQW